MVHESRYSCLRSHCDAGVAPVWHKSVSGHEDECAGYRRLDRQSFSTRPLVLIWMKRKMPATTKIMAEEMRATL